MTPDRAGSPFAGTIRRYQPGDEAAIARIYRSAIHELACADYTREQCEAWSGRGTNPDGWRERCERKRPLVNEVEGRVAGFMELDPDGHIDCTFVDPVYAGKGVMSALMEAVKAEAGGLGVDRLHAEVSITALPFFKRHGFTVLRENLVNIRGVELTNFIMECWLREPPAAGQRTDAIAL